MRRSISAPLDGATVPLRANARNLDQRVSDAVAPITETSFLVPEHPLISCVATRSSAVEAFDSSESCEECFG